MTCVADLDNERWNACCRWVPNTRGSKHSGQIESVKEIPSQILMPSLSEAQV